VQKLCQNYAWLQKNIASLGLFGQFGGTCGWIFDGFEHRRTASLPPSSCPLSRYMVLSWHRRRCHVRTRCLPACPAGSSLHLTGGRDPLKIQSAWGRQLRRNPPTYTIMFTRKIRKAIGECSALRVGGHVELTDFHFDDLSELSNVALP